jgi:PAS domain S-box-containing protein
MYGWKAEEVIGCNGLEIVRTEWLEKDAVEMRRVIAEKGHWRGEATQARKDGSRFPVEISSIVLYDDNQKVTGYVSVNRDITDRKQTEEALRMLNETLEQRVNEQTAEVRRLASDLTKAEQRERHRIAQILHEDLQQRIYAVKMQLEFLQEGLGTENRLISQEIASVNKQLAEILAHTRHLSVELSPPILRDEGLTQAFQWLAFQMEKQHGLQIAVRAEGSYFIADESLRVMLFTCVRELLFNIVKHAGVNQALVSLRQSNADLQIEVQDQGKGFDIAVLEEGDKIIREEGEPRRHSFGLPTLRHQLSLIGGQMEIQSEPDRGTFITITIPFA